MNDKKEAFMGKLLRFLHSFLKSVYRKKQRLNTLSTSRVFMRIHFLKIHNKLLGVSMNKKKRKLDNIKKLHLQTFTFKSLANIKLFNQINTTFPL